MSQLLSASKSKPFLFVQTFNSLVVQIHQLIYIYYNIIIGINKVHIFYVP